MLKKNMKAPEFTLPDKNGKMVSLKTFLGKKVVLYFYPKDDTPGCTKQACAFAAAYEGFRDANTAVIGVSRDSQQSHQEFADKYDLPFILLSDPELTAIKAYGVHQIEEIMEVERTTFIIDEKGSIEAIMPKVNPETNAAEILSYLKERAA